MRGVLNKKNDNWYIKYIEFCELIDGHSVIKELKVSNSDLEKFSNDIDIDKEVEFQIGEEGTKPVSRITRFVNSYLKDERFFNNNLNPKTELKQKLEPVINFISLLNKNNISFKSEDILNEYNKIDINAIEYYINKIIIS